MTSVVMRRMEARVRGRVVGRWLGGLLAAALAIGGLVLADATPAAAATDRLATGQVLASGQTLMSANGDYRLAMQTDGNAVVYNSANVAQWASRTSGNPGARLVVQGDGNVVIYSSSNVAVWASRTRGSGARLVMQGDGNLVEYSGTNAALWASKRSSGALDSLVAGERLISGQRLTSPDGRHYLMMQSDGNVVVYDDLDGSRMVNEWLSESFDRRMIWGTSTAGHRGASLAMQADGNVVLSLAGRPLWNTRTGRNGGARLVLQNNGNLVVYSAAGRALWSAGILPVGVVPEPGAASLLSCVALGPEQPSWFTVTFSHHVAGGVYDLTGMWDGTEQVRVRHWRGEPWDVVTTRTVLVTEEFGGEVGSFGLGLLYDPRYGNQIGPISGEPVEISLDECTG